MAIDHSHANFGGHVKDYYVIRFGRRAGIVAFNEGRVLLVRQYRFLINALSWELPGGTIEEAEDIKAGAIRECFEETGVRCRRLQELVIYYPGLDNVDNRTTIFYTHDAVVEKEFSGIPREVSEIKWLPLESAVQMVYTHQILDAMTVAGLLAYRVLQHDQQSAVKRRLRRKR